MSYTRKQLVDEVKSAGGEKEWDIEKLGVKITIKHSIDEKASGDEIKDQLEFYIIVQNGGIERKFNFSLWRLHDQICDMHMSGISPLKDFVPLKKALIAIEEKFGVYIDGISNGADEPKHQDIEDPVPGLLDIIDKQKGELQIIKTDIAKGDGRLGAFEDIFSNHSHIVLDKENKATDVI